MAFLRQQSFYEESLARILSPTCCRHKSGCKMRIFRNWPDLLSYPNQNFIPSLCVTVTSIRFTSIIRVIRVIRAAVIPSPISRSVTYLTKKKLNFPTRRIQETWKLISFGQLQTWSEFSRHWNGSNLWQMSLTFIQILWQGLYFYDKIIIFMTILFSILKYCFLP